MTPEQAVAAGGPFTVRIAHEDGETWRPAAEAWALSDGGFAWADLWWPESSGHPFHVRTGPSTPGEYGGPMCDDAELLRLAPGDPDRAQFDAWDAYRAGGGSHATRDRATRALLASGLLPDGVTLI